MPLDLHPCPHDRDRTGERNVARDLCPRPVSPTDRLHLVKHPAVWVLPLIHDQSLPHWIGQDIPCNRLPILAPTENVIVESRLPQCSLVSQLPALPGGVPLEHADDPTQGLLASQSKEDMEVIRHEAVGVEGDASM